MLQSETHEIEYKLILNDTFEKEVVAFLNSNGGVIYIGINDDGEVVGLSDIDDVVLKCSNKLSSSFFPSILGLYALKVLEKEGKQYIELTIKKGSEQPYYIGKYGMSPKGCYIRKGTACLSMNVKLIEQLFSKRVRNDLKKVVSPRQRLTFGEIKNYYTNNGYEIDANFLENLGFYTEEKKLNYLAYLFADNNTVSVKVGTFAGCDKTEVIRSEECGYCSLLRASARVLARLKKENKRDKGETKVDPAALKEAVLNAIIHQDYLNAATPVFEIYADRIEVTSSGGLPNGMSKKDFFEGKSIPANPDIMRIFKELHMIKSLGSGVQKIVSKYPQSIFEISDNFIVVTFPYAFKKKKC